MGRVDLASLGQLTLLLSEKPQQGLGRVPGHMHHSSIIIPRRQVPSSHTVIRSPTVRLESWRPPEAAGWRVTRAWPASARGRRGLWCREGKGVASRISGAYPCHLLKQEPVSHIRDGQRVQGASEGQPFQRGTDAQPGLRRATIVPLAGKQPVLPVTRGQTLTAEIAL